MLINVRYVVISKNEYYYHFHVVKKNYLHLTDYEQHHVLVWHS